MSPKKSLFSKYLFISLVIVLISFLILGVMLVFFVAQYSADEKQKLLNENANLVSDMIEERVVILNDSIFLDETDTNVVRNIISTISASINSDIFITDRDGTTLLCSEGGNCSHIQHQIPADIQFSTIHGKSFFESTLGNIYTTKHYVTGVPIYADTGNMKIIAGMVYASTESTFFSDVTGDIFKIFFFAAIATFVVVFCITSLFSYRMVKPLRQMSYAAHNFAKGDFSIRVPVSSNDEIGRLAEAFNHMADSVAMSENTRRSFIANVSHELKTPMTTIAGFIDGILDGTIPKEKQNYYLNIVQVEVRRLSRLVSSMLSLARIDNGELHLNKSNFNITNTIINTLLTFEQKISDKNIDIKGLENIQTVYIDGDPDMIHQVIYNLFENAVKFVNEGGYISVQLENLSDKITLEIKNSGHGIEPEELKHIFERFYKTDKSRSQDKNGMGLGLYIVKTIMRQHGGDIEAKSVVDDYCSFKLWLPKEKLQKQHKDKTDKIMSKSTQDKGTMIETTAEILSNAEDTDEDQEDNYNGQ